MESITTITIAAAIVIVIVLLVIITTLIVVIVMLAILIMIILVYVLLLLLLRSLLPRPFSPKEGLLELTLVRRSLEQLEWLRLAEEVGTVMSGGSRAAKTILRFV